ncbi:MAG: HPr family phosphocarrier protein [Micrococcales bacterium]|nr:MAG: HPr family phosphocarrier protein [Micrococcales bacterium]PIE27840.1 MAG: HPr family phosphocarrier protein [Micrococcales bacterium]
MVVRDARVGSPSGLHAKPAGLVAAAVARSGAPVRISYHGESVDAASALMIMTLNAGFGADVRLEGSDEALLDRLVRLVSADLCDLDYATCQDLVEVTAHGDSGRRAG